MGSPKYKVSRSLGCNIWGRPKDPFNFKNYFPGQHGPTSSRRPTPYGVQLRGKQRMKVYYNITERQFSSIFGRAKEKAGDTGENFVAMLESRLDMILYRANLVPTVFAAKQIVSHGHVLVNGKCLDIRSAMLKDGDVVTLTESAYKMSYIAKSVLSQKRRVPAYLLVSEDNKSAKVVQLAKFSEVPYECEIDLQMVIEYYSH
ncbi:MAG: 30S ribosomal protein S4 [Alphaproteobacteria bacterium]|nr:30S ribosomal protein S4 [Rickettsiales bacterium]